MAVLVFCPANRRRLSWPFAHGLDFYLYQDVISRNGQPFYQISCNEISCNDSLLGRNHGR